VSIWRRVRSLFPATEVGVYLDHAGTAPVSSWVEEAVRQFVEAAARRGGGDHEAKISLELARVRARVATLVGATPAEIAFVPHAERGLEKVAGDVDWRRGDVIAVAGDEGAHAWRNLALRGVEIHRVPDDAGALKLERVETALRRPRVRLLAISAVDPESGSRAPLADLGRLCEERGVLFCVDASHQLGCLELDVAVGGVDYLVSDAHRFLLGLAGTALLYRNRRCAQPEALASAAFESGPANALGITALGAAVDLLLELGVDRIERHVLELTDRLRLGLEARGIASATPRDATRSGIVAFRLGDEAPSRTAERLLARGFCVATTATAVRVSPHCYTRLAEIDALLDAL
jgi:selenocysteine lyase/cysteine desulfurase